MKSQQHQFDRLTARARSLGAHQAAVVEVHAIQPDASFRAMCASNACGMYGRCWMCPPHVGEIDCLIRELGAYSYALVVQTVSELEDPYDFEGMLTAGGSLQQLMQRLRPVFDEEGIGQTLFLGAGGCRVCTTCAAATGEPCRAPSLAMASLEAYGVNVSRLADCAGMNYSNGENTVTFFGMVLFCL